MKRTKVTAILLVCLVGLTMSACGTSQNKQPAAGANTEQTESVSGETETLTEEENHTEEDALTEEEYEQIFDDEFIDTDGDHIEEAMEQLMGTDPNNADTDGDGLEDEFEILTMETEPTMADTDGNGVSDGDEDFDGDGLSNKDEVSNGTSPRMEDTDGDGVPDYEEIQNNTAPEAVDTDEDGLSDKSEIRLGTDSDKADTDGNGIKDGDESYEQTILEENYEKTLFEDNLAIPSLIIKAKGDVNSRIRVTEYDGHLKGDEREYVGKVLEIQNSDMEEGTIYFTISEKYKVEEQQYGETTTNGLLICYNDGEDTYPLTTDYDKENRTFSTTLQGDGIYFVLNVIDWLESYDIDMEK